MKRRLQKFRKLRELKRVAELEAAQVVASARQVVERERLRLLRLQQEHTQRCAELARRQPGDSLEVDREFQSRIFVERLEKRIAQQAKAVVHATQRLEEHAKTLQQRRSERRALERFEERILLQLQQEMQRREQNVLDEIGINAFRGNVKDVT